MFIFSIRVYNIGYMDQAEGAPQPTERVDYRAIAGELGVVITPEMQAVVDEIKDLESGSDQFGELLGRIQMLAEAEIDKLDKSARAKAQIGLIVATSAVLREAGMDEAASENMADALDYAENMGFDFSAKILRDVIDLR